MADSFDRALGAANATIRYADRQNFTLEQLETAHATLQDLVHGLEEELRNGTA